MKTTIQEMNFLERLSKQVQDILDCRIDAVLEDMSLTALCDLPEDEPITINEFLKKTEDTCHAASQQLAK